MQYQLGTLKSKSMPGFKRREDTGRKVKKGACTHHHPKDSKEGKGCDVPFDKAKAAWRAIVAWRGGAIHLVGHIRPRRTLWKRAEWQELDSSGTPEALHLQRCPLQLLPFPSKHLSELVHKTLVLEPPTHIYPQVPMNQGRGDH